MTNRPSGPVEPHWNDSWPAVCPRIRQSSRDLGAEKLFRDWIMKQLRLIATSRTLAVGDDGDHAYLCPVSGR